MQAQKEKEKKLYAPFGKKLFDGKDRPQKEASVHCRASACCAPGRRCGVLSAAAARSSRAAARGPRGAITP